MMSKVNPMIVLWAGRIFGGIVAIILDIYVEIAFSPNDWARKLLVAVALVYLCINVFSYVFMRIGYEIVKRNQPKYDNLERL